MITDLEILSLASRHDAIHKNRFGDWMNEDEVLTFARELLAVNRRVVGYIHDDGMRFMPAEVFDAWRKLHATPERAAEWKPVARVG